MPPHPNPNPSEKQLEVVTFIIRHVEQHGYQPSQQEIADHFGVSKPAINRRLRELHRRNVIEINEGSKERAVGLKVRFVALPVLDSQ